MNNDFDFSEIDELLEKQSVEKPTPKISKKVSPNHEKRQERRSKTAEDFTPLPLVNEILDRLSLESNNEVWSEDKTFVDPACGNGNFLIEVLKRKLNKGHDPLNALMTIYGVDIMLDNIQETRLRLLKVLITHVKKHKLPKPNQIEVIKILGKNIKWTPLKNYPNGSLDYHFNFNDSISNEDAKKAILKIAKENLLDQVEID